MLDLLHRVTALCARLKAGEPVTRREVAAIAVRCLASGDPIMVAHGHDLLDAILPAGRVA